jgi:hypothetical protein
MKTVGMTEQIEITEKDEMRRKNASEEGPKKCQSFCHQLTEMLID